ncbi:MAG: alpha/beta fold hydrolase [Acidobacteria bacterium]|nr:alpha/beta fold hydrolase [Acidobacteriota bacterium]
MTTTPDGVPFVRTPDDNFADIADFPYATRHIEVEGLRMCFVDEGPRDAPVALMVHGMPTWSYLYRRMIPPLLAAGYRCVAPDHIGFGRSDKVTDPGWYDIARHTANLSRLVAELDLRDITLFVQDWGGPTGLAQYAAMPERFSRLVIMNTWLHHEGYEYTPGILQWIQQNSPGGLLRDNIPSKFGWGTLMTVATRRAQPQESLLKELQGGVAEYSAEALAVRLAYDAPFAGLGEPGVTGPRRFPMSIPAHDPRSGNAEAQARHFEFVNRTELPVHFVWGTEDIVFTTEWGRAWHALIPHSTWDDVPAGHFLQDTHGPQVVEFVLHRAGLA